MHLRLGLMSLARLALEVVEELVATKKLDRREVEQLPKRLVEMITGEKVAEAGAGIETCRQAKVCKIVMFRKTKNR